MLEHSYFDTQFGVSHELIRQVLTEAMARGGDFADLYFQHELSNSISMEDHVVHRATSSTTLGVGIRVVQDDQVGYAFTERLTPERMKAAARTAAQIACGTQRPGPVALSATALTPYYDLACDWSAVEAAQVMPRLRRMDSALRAHSAVRRASLSFNGQQRRILIVDSDGRMACDDQPLVSLVLEVTMEREGERQSNGTRASWRSGLNALSDAALDALSGEALAQTEVLFEARRAPPGEMPVVLAAGASGILLHEAIGHGLEADYNRLGTSIFSERLGSRVAAPEVTIIDDGTLPGLRGSINVDDEGTPTQETVLVQQGVLNGYLHDRISANHFGVPPTGNGRRQSFRHAPIPRMRNTYMQAGPHSRDDILSSVKRGIYAVTFTNGQVRIGPGDYTFYVKNGYLIEDGKLTAPLKDVNIIGNGPESLSRISMVGNDWEMARHGGTCGKQGQAVPVGVGLPTVRVDAVTVGGVA